MNAVQTYEVNELYIKTVLIFFVTKIIFAIRYSILYLMNDFEWL